MLTVYGIETGNPNNMYYVYSVIVATVLTVYGIETFQNFFFCYLVRCRVATVLTVYGIETSLTVRTIAINRRQSCNSAYRLRY